MATRSVARICTNAMRGMLLYDGNRDDLGQLEVVGIFTDAMIGFVG